MSNATPVIFTYGRPESFSKNACYTVLHSMDVDKVIDIGKMFDGSFTDLEIIKTINGLYKTIPSIDKTKFTEKYNLLTSGTIKHYFEKLKQTDTYLADNPRILETLMAIIESVNGKAKEGSEKPATEKPEENNTATDDDKKKQLMGTEQA